MSDNLLTPVTGTGAGILHRLSMEFAASGPWLFAGVTWGDAVDGPADGEPMRPEHRPRGGTCAICSAAIINIVDVRNRRTGERATLGVDCAGTMWKNQSMPKNLAAFRKAQAPHEKAKREAAKVRKIARDAAYNLVAHAEDLVTLDRLSQQPVGSFARSFAASVARDLRSGHVRGITARQADCLARLAAEIA